MQTFWCPVAIRQSILPVIKPLDLFVSRMPRVLQRPAEVLEQLVWLLIVRKLYERCGSYEAVYDRWPFLFGTFSLLFQCVKHTERNNIVSWRLLESTFWDILTGMKINIEESDHCTLAAKDIFKTLEALVPARLYLRLCHSFIQVIIFFGSRRCLQDLQQFILDEGASLRPQGLRLKITNLIKNLDSPHEWVTRSFNPNRIRRRYIRKAKRAGNRAARAFSKFRVKSGWQVCSLRHARHRTKRYVASLFGRTLGNFVGKNFFQLCKLAKPALFTRTRERAADLYSETGPGARSALNQLEGFSKTLHQYTNTQDVANSYNVLLLKWRKVWRKACKAVEKVLPDELKPLAASLHDYDEGQFQFVLCELSKVICFIDTGCVIYTRDYWNSA